MFIFCDKMNEELNKLKTGTTTVGIKTKDAVILGADSRATMGNFIANKNMDKVQKINDRMAMTVAGSVGDAQKLVRWMRSEVDSYELSTQQEMKVSYAANLLSNVLSAYKYMPFWVQLLLGGVDSGNKPSLFSIDMIGGVTEEDYTATGSGTTLALGAIESHYSKNMSNKEAIELAALAVFTATKRDSASGDNVRVAIIDKKGFRFVKRESVIEIINRK